MSHYERYWLGRVTAFTLNGLEDKLHRLLPNQWKLLRPIWYCRFLLNEGSVRRKLRSAVKAWDKSGTFQSEDYFRDYDLGKDLKGKIITVRIEYRNERP